MKPVILVIDDVPEVIELLQVTLGVDYEVLPAKSGQEAVDIAIKTKSDLIILDWHLSERDILTGLDTCQALCAIHSDVPIVILSGVADTTDLSNIMAVCDCVVKYVKKPYYPSRLLKMVKGLIK